MGIDPGFSGALAVLNDELQVDFAMDMRIIGIRTVNITEKLHVQYMYIVVAS